MTRCLHYCEAVVKETEEHFDVILQFLCELVLRNHSVTLLPGQSSSSEKLSLVSSHTRKTRGKSQSFIMTRLCEIVDTAINSLSSQSKIHSHDHLWASLLCLSYYRYTATVQVIYFYQFSSSPVPVSLSNYLQRLFSLLKQTSFTNNNNDNIHLMAQCLMTMVATCSTNDLITHVPYEDIIDLLRCSVHTILSSLLKFNVRTFRHFSSDWHVLSAVLHYQLQLVDRFTDQLDVVFPLLVRNLNSPYHKVHTNVY